MFSYVARGTEIKSDKAQRPAFYSWLFRTAAVIFFSIWRAVLTLHCRCGDSLIPLFAQRFEHAQTKCCYFNCLVALCILRWQQGLRAKWMSRARPFYPASSRGHPAPTPSQPKQGDTVPAAGCTRAVGRAQAFQGSCRLLGWFLCSLWWSCCQRWWWDCRGKVFSSKTDLQVAGCCASSTDC